MTAVCLLVVLLAAIVIGAVVLVRRGRTARSVAVTLPGGTLGIDWLDDTATLAMSGPTAFVFEGEWST